MVHAQTCAELGLRHLRTRPYRPRTNGKAERFIQTMLREWAYGRLFSNSREQERLCPSGFPTTTSADHTGSLGHQPPALGSPSSRNNLVRNYI